MSGAGVHILEVRGRRARARNPWVHYVPLANDLLDLEERVSWARQHDDEVRAITARAQQFALESLSDDAILGYLHLLLRAYARLLKPD